MLRNTTNFQQNTGSSSSQRTGQQNQSNGNQDASRAKPNFQEQNRHYNNESDISDEDMGDIDENVVNNKNVQKGAAKSQSSIQAANSSQTRYGQQQYKVDQSKEKQQIQQQSLLKQPGFMTQNAKQNPEKQKLEMISKLSTSQQQQQMKQQYESGGLLHTVNEEQSYDPEKEADFDKAYNKLVKKFYQEQGPNLLIPDEDLHKADQKGFDALEVQRKIQEQARKKEEKILQMKAIKEEKELEGCTFAPQMLTKKKNNQPEKRDLNKFLEDQQKYLEMKELRQNERKEKMMQSEQSMIGQVTGMNEKSKKILEKKKKQGEEQPVAAQDNEKNEEKKTHSLTRKSKQLLKNQSQHEIRKRLASPQPKETFNPSISKKSQQMVEQKRHGQKIEDHLIMEGKKTKEKQAKKEQDERKQTQAKITNKTSEKYIIQKFTREFEQLITEMFSQIDQSQEEQELQKDQKDNGYKFRNLKVNYLRLKELLVNFGMINEQNANNDSQERALLYELWKLLKGEEKEEISLEDVKMVIMAILRMTDHKRIGLQSETQQTEGEQQDPKNFGFYNDNDQFCLRAEDLPKVQKNFNIFYLNRLQFIGKVLEQQKARKAQEEEFNYKPQLNENSSHIAAKYRQKIAEQIKEEKITTFEWLAAAGNKEAWREHAKKIIDDEEMKECTFKPQRITEKSDASKNVINQTLDKSTNQVGAKKYEELYALSKQGKVKSDKTKEDYEYERNKEELTFQPKLQIVPARKQNQESQGQITQDKHVQKQMDRLQKGREEKERIKMFTERGVANPPKENAGAVNESVITATSKRPNQNRKSPIDPKMQNQNRKLDNVELDKHGLNSMFDNNMLVSPSKDGNDEMNSSGAGKTDTEKERTPLLFVDVNLGGDNSERIIVFEGDTADALARRFCDEHNLDDVTQEKLEELLQSQISSVLTKIEEEDVESNVYSHGNNI